MKHLKGTFLSLLHFSTPLFLPSNFTITFFVELFELLEINQPVFICSKSTMETKEKCVKSVQSQQWKQKKNE